MTLPRQTNPLQVAAPGDPLAALTRADKHYLGAGDGTLFAPPHPVWLERPGFWDGGHVFLYALRPLFTVSFVQPDGGALVLRPGRRTWTPAELRVEWDGAGWALTERRVVLPGGRFASAWEVETRGEGELTLVAWTAWEGAALPERAQLAGGSDGVRARFHATDAQLRTGELDLDVVLSFHERSAHGWAIHESQHPRLADSLPDWDVTPFRDRWQVPAGRRAEGGGPVRDVVDGARVASGGGLRGARTAADAPPGAGRTLVYAAIAVPLSDAAVTVMLQATPASADSSWHARSPAPAGSVARASRASWTRFFADTPALGCSDPYLEQAFRYRWYGLRLNFLAPAGNYRHPTVSEGIEFFHCPIAYSAWCHAHELRWLPDPARARGVLRTFFDHQRPDGQLPGRVYLDHMRRTDFYYADWGGSVLAVDEVHPDRAFLEEAYGPLQRYADWVDADRDREGSGLFDVRDQYETGQETMSRYTAVDPDADRSHFEYRLRLKGVDLTVYQYRLRRALARIAAALGRRAESIVHEAAADRIAEAVRTFMWDPATGMFSDVDPRTMTRTGVRAAVCFYPYMTDIAGPEHLAGLQMNLFDPASFWTPWPVPSTAVSDPTFDADAAWKGVRQHCTWNGRVWPMTNSHVMEALGRVATTAHPALRARTADFLARCLRLLFFDRDPARPNCFEHYSPDTGWPCVYRGIDDYMHSWVNDLVIRFVAGVRPAGAGFVLDPLPLAIERLELTNLPFRGQRLNLVRTGEHVSVSMEGRVVIETHVDAPVEVTL